MPYAIPNRYGIPDFWANIHTIISFAKDIHHEMQTLQHICLDALQSKADQVRDNMPNTIYQFNNALTDFHSYWLHLSISNTLQRLVNGGPAVESAICSLKEHLQTLHDHKYTHLCRVFESYQKLWPLLTQYHTYRDRLEMDNTPELIITVTQLSAKTKFLLTHADNMLRDMAILMSEI